MQNIPVIIIVGQTATGKSDVAVQLAKELNGEVISADSRQVYKEFNLTSGKITKKEMQGVKHHLLDVISAKTRVFTAFDFKTKAEKAILQIHSRGKIPIVAGGTGFYIDTLVGLTAINTACANKELRERLSKYSASELFSKLKKLDTKRAKNIDKNNKVRLIRAIEIARDTGATELSDSLPLFPVWIGLKWDKETLKKRIWKRLLARHNENMCQEVKKAKEQGVSWKRLEELGLEMRYCAKYIKGELDEEGFLQILNKKIWQFAKRQATYWRRNKEIKWFNPNEYQAIKTYAQNKLKELKALRI